ncbi:MAG TPA: NBR1-Ig-like domain-containing protein [Anaerolineales bacterium]
MRQKINVLVSTLAALALLLSACGGTQPSPDASAISTAAAQTVEARFTEQAAAFTPTTVPATETPTPQPTATQAPEANAPISTPATSTNGKPCYTMTFLADVSVPDGMIVAPGAKFTKTWRVRNDGNCVWDQKYSLELDKGDALGTVTKFPLTRVVNPGDTIDLSVDMTAPSADGSYAGFWHISTPFGGYMGVAPYNQSLLVKITVSSKPDRDFGVVGVIYDMTRRPQTGCGSDGAAYDFKATITVNGPGEINYRWDRNPFDGTLVGGTLKFTAAGSKTVTWTWNMTKGHIENIDRWVAITTIIGSQETQFNRVLFNFTCN